MGRSLALASAVGVAIVAAARFAAAATIMVGPSDDYTKIEAAGPGDTVVIAPGTYKFRVYLSQQGTAAQPITIQAQDPNNPPVWDLGGKLVEQWPGSYTGGDNGRGCWQIGGGTYYVIDGIVLQNCQTASQNAAGIRYNAADHVTLRNLVVHHNEMGITGDGTNVVVELSEIDHNGQPANTNEETHNLYVYGGSFTLRWSYVHDSLHGQNFHLRCLDCRVESNWIARAQNYEGDLMPTGDGMPTSQKLLLLGNVIVQAASPENGSFLVAPYNDTGATGLSFEVDMLWNTIIGNGGQATLLMFNNQDLAATTGVLSNNVVVGLGSVYGSTVASKTTMSGSNNWLVTGAMPTAGLTGTLFGTSPGLDSNYRPMPGSPLIGAADTSVMPVPTTEYYENETVTRMYRQRLTAKDIGAFESTTMGGPADGGGGGGDAGGPTGDASLPGDAGTSGEGGTAGDAGSGPAGSSAGCGCRASSDSQCAGLALGALSLMAVGARRMARRARG